MQAKLRGEVAESLSGLGEAERELFKWYANLEIEIGNPQALFRMIISKFFFEKFIISLSLSLSLIM